MATKNKLKRIAMLLFLTLVTISCSSNDTSAIRFKVIASLDIDGQIKEFSNVMQVEYTRFDRPTALGRGGKSKTWGEALVVDLGDHGKIFMLPAHFNERSKSFTSAYVAGILRTFNIDASVGSLKKTHIDKLRNLSGRKKLQTYNEYTRYDVSPAFVYFEQEDNPKSVKYLKPENFSKFFGRNIELKQIDIQITDDPITENKLFEHLPWLKNKKSILFDRAPLPNSPPRTDWNINWVITRNNFLGTESR